MKALQWLLHSACHVLGHPANDVASKKSDKNKNKIVGFEMPLHYPRYTKEEYMKMEEWKMDLLLQQYGLRFEGTLQEKRDFAMGAFLWPHQR